MAEKLQEFTQRFNELQVAAKAGLPFVVKYKTVMAGWKDTHKKNLATIKTTAQSFKGKGLTAAGLRRQPTIAQAITELHRLDSFAEEAEKWYLEQGYHVHNNLQKLLRDCLQDITKRRSALTTKLRIGNKSLSDIVELHVKVTRFAERTDIQRLMALKPERPVVWKQAIERDILAALAAAK